VRCEKFLLVVRRFLIKCQKIEQPRYYVVLFNYIVYVDKVIFLVIVSYKVIALGLCESLVN